MAGAEMTGLGGNFDPVLLDNRGTVPKQAADDAIAVFFEKWGGFDFHVDANVVAFGIEPSYQFDPLLIVSVHRNKEQSTFRTGRAFGSYGSDIRSRTKRYSDFKRASRFTAFVDRWHNVLFDPRPTPESEVLTTREETKT